MKKFPTPKGGWGALALALLVVIFAAFGVTAGGDPPDPTPTVTVPGGAGIHSAIVTPDADAQVTAPSSWAGDQIGSHEDEVDEQPVGAPPNAAATVAAAANATPTNPQPVAGAQGYSCPFKPVGNYSNRISKAIQFVVHETVSAPGSMGVIWRLFNTRSFGASSHYLLEVTGRCLKIVALSAKAWTQGAFNSASISVEIIAPSGSTRAWWMKQKIIKRGILAALIRDNLKFMGSPLRWVDPVGCTPRAGWTDHEHLECGNDHCDVTGCDAFPRELVARQVRAGVSSPADLLAHKRCHHLALLRQRANWRRKTGRKPAWIDVRIHRATKLKNQLGSKASSCR